ncbi:mitochondrial sodium/calcium exchanger protein-like [Clavelina lepadiformis]|uniref:mitochondrial sodium/calcium exchanger protein-like n=1 Tax=Clavelina lepadiformis TaxID=159417 RepID=UPI00404118E9
MMINHSVQLLCILLFLTQTTQSRHAQDVNLTFEEDRLRLSVEGDSAKKDVECRDYHSLHNSSLWCQFVNTTDNCAMDEGFINYIKVAFCETKPKNLPLIATGYAVWLILLFVGLGTTAEGYFCPALEFIAANLRLSHNIAGLTIVAFGNGSPDIFSAIAAFTNSNPTAAGVAIGALLGAAMMVTTVVAGLVATTQSFEVAKRPFMRDMIFFIATAFWIFCLLYQGSITLLNSIGFLCLYVFYVGVVIVGRYIHQRQRARNFISKEMQNEENVDSVNKATSYDERSRLLSPPPINTSIRNTNNNNADSEREWVDVRIRTSSWATSTHKHHNNQDGAEEAEKNVTSGEFSDDDDEHEIDFNGRSVFFMLATGLNPLDAKDWREARHVFKIIILLQVPWNFLCKATIPVVKVNGARRNWNRPLNCLNLILAPIFCVFATKGGDVTLGDIFPLWALFLTIGCIAATVMWFTSNNLQPPVYHWVLAYVGFVIAIIWTYIIANEIVNLLQTFGVIFNVSNVVMGLTFLAWGNSIGDVVADVTLAKQGFPRMSWSACFGGPLFNLLIGVGLPCTITNIKHGGDNPILVSFSTLEAVLCGGVFLSLCFTFVVVPLRRFQLTPKFGMILVALYVVWVIFAVLAGVNVFG